MKEPAEGREAINNDASNRHPSRNLTARARGYGIGGGYERPYRKPEQSGEPSESYGPLPHSGYYGAGVGPARFKQGQASFTEELSWYRGQYGATTIGQNQSRERR